MKQLEITRYDNLYQAFVKLEPGTSMEVVFKTVAVASESSLINALDELGFQPPDIQQAFAQANSNGDSWENPLDDSMWNEGS